MKYLGNNESADLFPRVYPARRHGGRGIHALRDELLKNGMDAIFWKAKAAGFRPRKG
jgi:hypothetical protein